MALESYDLLYSIVIYYNSLHILVKINASLQAQSIKPTESEEFNPANILIKLMVAVSSIFRESVELVGS